MTGGGGRGDDSDPFWKRQLTGGSVYSGPGLARPAAGPLGGAAEADPVQYTRFEKARIVGARALQLSMGAPPLIEVPADIKNPVQVAMREYEADAIPLTVVRSEHPTQA
jgi:DNA-directed RNA polymerase subunit K